MKRIIIDKRNGWESALKGEQYYPTGRVKRNGVMTPDEMPADNEPGEEISTGVWAHRHLDFIKQYHKGLYLDLFYSGKLGAYLADLDAQAENLFLRTVKELSIREGVTEKLKAENQMEWVRRTNSIRNRATEIVNNEIVFA